MEGDDSKEKKVFSGGNPAAGWVKRPPGEGKKSEGTRQEKGGAEGRINIPRLKNIRKDAARTRLEN